MPAQRQPLCQKSTESVPTPYAPERGNRSHYWGGIGRVGEGDCSPPPPTDPDMQDYRIRLLAWKIRYVRYTEWTTMAFGSG